MPRKKKVPVKRPVRSRSVFGATLSATLSRINSRGSRIAAACALVVTIGGFLTYLNVTIEWPWYPRVVGEALASSVTDELRGVEQKLTVSNQAILHVTKHQCEDDLQNAEETLRRFPDSRDGRRDRQDALDCVRESERALHQK